MLIIQYILLALVTVFATNRASFFINELDKKTLLSAALLGGVFLAVVTSLPEFITSITSTILLNNPSLAFGNVFGSNMFNLLILATIDLIFVKHLFFNKVKSGIKTSILIILLYSLFLLPILLDIFTSFTVNHLAINIGLSFSLISLVVLVIYAISVKSMQEDLDEKAFTTSKYRLKTIVIAFISFGILVVMASYFITLVTNDIAIKYDINATFAGAVFLGIATSLPELTAIISLIKLRSYDIALGNILGSNIFNMLIITSVDFIYIKENIFSSLMADDALSKNISLLLILGLINSIIVLVALMRKTPKSKGLYIIPSILIILSYGLYIGLSI